MADPLEAAPGIYASLIGFLRDKEIAYRLMEHEAKGNTIRLSEIRGHPLQQAAKSMVTYLDRRDMGRKYVLAVVPGDRKIDMKHLGKLFSAKKAQFASPADAACLTGCEMGAVPPISFNQALTTVFDAYLAKEREIVFNAGRLDISVAVQTADFLEATSPAIMSISEPRDL